MYKILNKAQKMKEVHKQANELAKQFKAQLIKRSESILYSGSTPDEYYEKGNYLLVKCAAYSMRDEFTPKTNITKEEFENIEKFV
jgi:hypothetical protein